jgi:hypothetical protein
MAPRTASGKGGRNPAGRFGRRLLAGLAALALLVGLAPLLVAHTPLLDAVARWALADFKGSVSVGRASLAWLSAPVLEDVELRDAAGRTLLSAPRIEAGKSLLALAWDPGDLGTFRVERPVLSITATAGPTNLEEALAGYLEPGTGGSTPLPALRVEIVEGRAVLRDEDAGREWTLDNLNLSLATPRDGGPIQVRCDGAAAGGPLGAEVAVRLPAGPAGVGVEGKIDLASFPLAALAPFVRRLQPGADLDGRLEAHLEGRWGGSPAGGRATGRLKGRVSVRGLALAAPVLGPDRVRLDRADLTAEASVAAGRVSVRQAEASCDAGKVSVAGEFGAGLDPGALLETPGYHAEAEVDLARLAGLLAGVVPLEKDVRVTSGRLTLRVASAPRTDGVAWEGSLHATALRGERRGAPVTWQDPVDLDFRLVKTPRALPVIESWHCDGGFFQVFLAGSAEQLTLNLRCDLDRLAAQLAQVADLGPVRPAGQGVASLTLRGDAFHGIHAQGRVDLRHLQLAGLTPAPVREDSVSVQADLSGQAGRGGSARIDYGSLRLEAGADYLDLQLLEPLAEPSRGPWARCLVHAGGDLARWYARARPWLGGDPGVQVAGSGELVARLRPGPEGVELEDGRLTLRDARLWGAGLNVSEPSLEVKTSGRWLGTPGRLELRETQVTCPTLTARSQGLQAALAPAGVEGGGVVAVEGNLGRLERWFRDPAAGGPEKVPGTFSEKVPGTFSGSVGGTFSGRVEVRAARGDADVSADGDVRDLVLGNPRAPAWREPHGHLLARGRYEGGRDLFRVDEARVDIPALTATASGQVARLSGSRDLTLAGEWKYDLTRLGPGLGALLGPGAQVKGAGTRPFRVEGSLAAGTVALTGEGALGWESADVCGCRLGAGELKETLAGGWLRGRAVEAGLNEGRLRLEPAVRLGPGPLELHLAKGNGVERFHLTPGACASALGYALPALANVLEAEGQLSLVLDAGRVPLADPAAAEVEGRFVLHSGRVAPGPMLRELGTVLKAPAGATLAKESTVPFRMTKGRIYHRDLELVFPEVTVRTQGSVGVDGSLDLVVEMPVPARWVGGGAARALAGKTVRLPVRGTLASPKVDEHALQAAMAQAVRDAGGEAVRQELDRRLKDALKPHK